MVASKHFLVLLLCALSALGFSVNHPEPARRWTYSGRLTIDGASTEGGCGTPGYFSGGESDGLLEQFANGDFYLLGWGCTTAAFGPGDTNPSECQNSEREAVDLPPLTLTSFQLDGTTLTFDGTTVLAGNVHCFRYRGTAATLE